MPVLEFDVTGEEIRLKSFRTGVEEVGTEERSDQFYRYAPEDNSA